MKEAGRVISHLTPYGSVEYYPESAKGLTLVHLVSGESLRLHGALKRVVLTMVSELATKAKG